MVLYLKTEEFDGSKLAVRIRKENAEYDRAMEIRRTEARAEAVGIAEKIAKEISCVKLILGLGSVFEENCNFNEHSDIDLAIKGGDYFSAFRIAEQSDFKIDLIDITGKTDSFSKQIRERGTILIKDDGMIDYDRIIKECFWDMKISGKDLDEIVNGSDDRSKAFFFEKLLANSTKLLKDLQIFSREDLGDLLDKYKLPQFNSDYLFRRKNIAEVYFFDKPLLIEELIWPA